MRINEEGTNSELLSVNRPLVCCAVSPCKCCCYQTASFSSGETHQLGHIVEDCYYCVPSFTIKNAAGQAVYKVRPPTCCCGVCFNCCTEGSNLGAVCCKVPFRVYDANATGEAAHLGKILKIPKSLKTEVFTDANAFEGTCVRALW